MPHLLNTHLEKKRVAIQLKMNQRIQKLHKLTKNVLI